MALFGTSSAPAPTAAAAIIVDGDTQRFAQDVIQGSMTTPVLVDFWAPWCGPCKQLTPLLEKLVTAAKGKVRLVKINIDENPELAQQFRIQSVPTVYAFFGGQPVTGFAGAQPESQIKQLIEQLVRMTGSAGEGGPDDVALILDEAKALAEAGDPEQAAQIYGEILREEPENPVALAGLARCLVTVGDFAAADSTLAQAPASLANNAEIMGAKAALALARESGDLGDQATLTARLEADPDDHEARLKLATLMFLRGQPDQAIEQVLRIVRKDRSWEDDRARKQLVRFFDALGAKHPATLKGRRALSSVLFS